MPRISKTRTVEPAAPSEETPLWKLLQQVQQQSKTKEEHVVSEKIHDAVKEVPETGEVYSSKELVVKIETATAVSLIRFLRVFQVYIRLISKAMNQDFHIPEEMLSGLQELVENQNDTDEVTRSSVIQKIMQWNEHEEEQIRGIALSETELRFTGFSSFEDPIRLGAYQIFFETLEKYSRTCRTMTLNVSFTESEKYDMYQLFLRIHANKPPYKTMRKYLLEHLDGYCAFPNEKTRKKWMKKNNRKQKN